MNPKPLKGNVLIKMNVKQKEKYQLTKDVVLDISRGYEFNLRLDRASYGYVISSYSVPNGARGLFHHLSSEPSYEIGRPEEFLTLEEIKEGFKVFSIPEDMQFCYDAGEGWKPCKNFLITERIFKPYKGKMAGVPHEQVKNRMYVVKGNDEWDGEVSDLSGKVVVSLVNCDYQIIFHMEDHKEYNLIRTRHREIIGIDEGMTKDVQNGKYLIGLTENNCKLWKN